MSTQANVEATPTGAKEKPVKARRPNVHVAFQGADGSRFKVTLKIKKDGTAVTYAVHSVKEGKKWRHDRGATTKHPSMEAAVVAQDALVSAALKRGWVHRVVSSGFKAKPDVFDLAHLPTPTKSKK